MRYLALALSMSAVILTARTVPAQPLPPTLDHLVCYRTLDKLQVKTSTDLIAQLQPEFTQKGCTLIKPIEFCVPATKTNVIGPPTAAIAQPVNPNIIGPPLKTDYVCYLAKCKTQVRPPDKKVVDQFGAHLQQKYKLSKVCVPAIKGPAGCPIGPIAKGGPLCQGTCPNHTDVCKTFSSGGTTTCDCVPKNKLCGGPPDAAGMCGGDCPPDPTDPVLPRCVLTKVSSTTGAVAVKCACEKPKDPICSRDAATGACGGACPLATQKCVTNLTTGQCDCETPDVPCQATLGTSGALQCGGVCPVAGQTCQPDPTTGKCSCDPPAPCSQDAAGACGGTCPAPEVCVFDTTTSHCGCGPRPCGTDTSTTPQSCSGACPLGATCAIDSTGACNCHDVPPPPCTLDPATNACGGSCPTAQHCAGDATTGKCNCVPDATPCHSPDAAGVCGGICPAQTVCLATSPTTCNCVPQAQQCRPGPAPCGGLCPNVTQTCSQTPGTTSCGCNSSCQPTGGPCTSDFDCCSNICNGVPNGVCS